MACRPHDTRAGETRGSPSWQATYRYFAPLARISSYGASTSLALSSINSGLNSKVSIPAISWPFARAPQLHYSSLASPIYPPSRTVGTSRTVVLARSLLLQRPSIPTTVKGNGSDTLFIRRLDKAESCSAVIRLLEQRPASLSVAFINPVALQAFARCLGLGVHAGKGQPAVAPGELEDEELESVQEVVEDLLLELHTRAEMLSFSQLADTVSALVLLLPALWWEPESPELITDLAAKLPSAAASSNAINPLSLKELCHAFNNLVKLTRLTSMRAAFNIAPEAGISMRNVVVSVLQGPHGPFRELKGADLALLAAVVELVALLAVPPPEPFVSACMDRVRVIQAELVRAAAAATAALATAATEASSEATGNEQRSSDDWDADSGGKAEASSTLEGSGSGRGHGSGKPGTARSSPPSSFQAAVAKADANVLDAPSLARLVEAWCFAVPSSRKDTETAWLVKTAAAVLRSQDPTSATRRRELRGKLLEVGPQLPGLREKLESAESALLELEKQEKKKRRAAREAAGRRGGRAGPGRSGRGLRVGLTDTPTAGVVASSGTDAPVDDGNVVDSVAARVKAAKASLAAAEKEFEALRAALAEVAAAAPRLADEQLVSLLGALRGRLGEGAGEEVCRLAEAAVADRVDTMQPQLLVRAFALCVHMGPSSPEQFTVPVLKALQPHLAALPSSLTVALLASLQKLRYVPPLKGKLNRADFITVIARAEGTSPKSELVVLLLQTCAAWGVPYPTDMLDCLEEEVERRVYKGLKATELRSPVGKVQVQAYKCIPGEGSNDDRGMRSLLLEGWVLPLAQLRQRLRYGNAFYMALSDYLKMNTDSNALDERMATLLLNSFASNASASSMPSSAPPSWPLTPSQREAIETVVKNVLSQPPQDPGVRAQLLLAAARALRVIATKMSWAPDDPFVGAYPPGGRRPSSLLIPAVEELMQLKPSAEHLSYVAQALFVELQYEELKAAPSSGDKQQGPNPEQRQQQDVPMLKRIMKAAAPTMSSCTPESCAYFLAACAAAHDQAPAQWLTALYHAAAAALTSAVDDGDGTTVDAKSLGMLLDGMAAVEERGLVKAASKDPNFETIRDTLLQALALAMLKEPALSGFTAQPDALATAVRQLAVLGVRPPPGWLSQYVACVQGLLGRMSLSGLAYTSEGLALLHAAPPNVFIDILLVQAGRRKVDTADPLLRGLLLGGVHALWQNGGRQERQEMAPLSKAARDVWALAHVATIDQVASLHLYSPAQLVMLVDAVAGYKLSSRSLCVPATLPASSAAPSGSRRGSGSGVPRVREAWLAECGMVLLECRRSRLRTNGNVFMPSTSFLLKLLGLAAPVLRRSYGARASWLRQQQPSVSATAEELPETVEGESGGVAVVIAKYISLSLGDIARASELGTSDTQGTVGGGTAASVGEWGALLRAALSVHICPNSPELSAYASALIPSIAQRVRMAASSLTPAASGSSTAAVDKLQVSTAVAQLQKVWSELEAGLQGVLLPVLPWLPRADLLQALREGLLEQGPALQHASPRQLALLCTMCSQAGPGLATQDCWQRVGAELQRRLQLLPPPEQQDAAGSLKLHGGMAKFTAMDLAAVCYGLDAAGCPLPATAASWLRQLLRVSVASNSSGTGQVADPSAVWGGWHHSVGMVLPALQLLWAARCCGCLGEVPEEVWRTAYGGRDPWVTGMDRLQPRQLAQLVVLYRERAYGGSGGSGKGLPVLPSCFVTAWMEPLGKAYEQERQGQGQQHGQGLLPPPHLGPELAAWAVAYCKPDGYQAPGLLVEAALPGLAAELPLEDVRALLGVLHTRSGWSLPQRHLEGLVARLLGPAAGGEGAQERQGRKPGGHSGTSGSVSTLAEMPGLEAFKLIQATLYAAPATEKAMATIEPLFTTLMPYAEEELYCMVAPGRIRRAVLATALGVPTSCATVVATAVAAAVEAIVAHQQEHLLRQQPANPYSDEVGAGGMLSSLSSEALVPIASAVIAAGRMRSQGLHRLPRGAAAVLLRLLSVHGVVEGLSYTELTAVGYVLDDYGLPMSDGVAAAINAKLHLAGSTAPDLDAVARAENLYQCGASATLLHKALLAVGGLRSYSKETMLSLLRSLVASGVREQLAVVERPCYLPAYKAAHARRKPPGAPEGTFAVLAERFMQQIAREACNGNFKLPDAAEALQLAAALVRQLDGASNFYFEHHIIVVALGVVRQLPLRALEGSVTADPDALWRFLGALNELGAQRFNDIYFMGCLKPFVVSGLDSTHLRWAAEEEVVEAGVRNAHFSFMCEFGPYYLATDAVLKLARATTTLVNGHYEALTGWLKEQEEAVELRRQQQQQQEAPKPEGVSKAPGWLGNMHGTAVSDVFRIGADSDGGGVAWSYGKPLPADPRLLSARQLGLLCGVMFLRGQEYTNADQREVLKVARLVAPLYHDMLHRLAARTDLPPLEHLTAVLDALEPVLLSSTVSNGRLVPQDFYKNWGIEQCLVKPVARVLADSSEPSGDGDQLWDDAALIQSPFKLNEETLLEALYLPGEWEQAWAVSRQDYRNGLRIALWRSQAFARQRQLALPKSLQPPPGRRHGQPGDPAGDAAREAYVQAAAPWVLAARRVFRLLVLTGRCEEMCAEIRRLGVRANTQGRWAVMMGYAVDPETTNDAVLAPLRAQYADAEAVVKVTSDATAAAAATAAAHAWTSVLSGAVRQLITTYTRSSKGATGMAAHSKDGHPSGVSGEAAAAATGMSPSVQLSPSKTPLGQLTEAAQEGPRNNLGPNALVGGRDGGKAGSQSGDKKGPRSRRSLSASKPSGRGFGDAKRQ